MNGDFIQTLSKDEKVVFVKAFMHMVCSDAKIDERERSFMHEMIAIYGLNDVSELLKNRVGEEMLLQEIGKGISRRQNALYLLQELLIIANIDEELNDKEVAFIGNVAQVLGIEDEKVLQIHELVLERKLWLQKQDKIMTEK